METYINQRLDTITSRINTLQEIKYRAVSVMAEKRIVMLVTDLEGGRNELLTILKQAV